MQQEFQIHHADNRYSTTSFTFPGGEVQLQVLDLPEHLTGDVTVVARLQSAQALVKLLLLDELLGRVHREGRRTLVVPYFPYARQDRVMRHHEAFSLKAIARLVNSLGFDEVVTCDPHSDVTPALVDNIRVIPQVDLVAAHESLAELLRTSKPLIVAPDAGAAKKAFAVAQRFSLPMLTASKVRDTSTGAILHTTLNTPTPLTNCDVLIVDDICDGGRTFIELAKVLKWSCGTDRVFLYVTHGIFSQGMDVFSGLIDGVFTTDSFGMTITELSSVSLHVSPLHF